MQPSHNRRVPFLSEKGARHLFVTEAALPIPPEEENTSGVKLALLPG